MIKNIIPYLATVATLSAGLPEVDLVFYGKVLHLGGGQPYVMTQGELSWTMEGTSGEIFTSTVSLSGMKGGEMSYQVRVPQQLVVANTLAPVFPGLPIPNSAEGEVFANTDLSLNGEPLQLADPSGFLTELTAANRGTFKRLDLIYAGDLPDRDEDGLPDWWEEKYGTDINLADADLDADGDSVSNRNEYLLGTDPVGDDQVPTLASEYLVNLPIGGTAVPVIVTQDSDSLPERLIFSASAIPAEIALRRIGSEAAITTFTQKDLNEGRILISHLGEASGEAIFSIAVSDETEAHPAALSEVRVVFGELSNLTAGLGLTPDQLPDDFPALQDASRIATAQTLRSPSAAFDWTAFSTYTDVSDLARLYVGSSKPDIMLGSSKADLFLLGDGDKVRPGAGADRIILSEKNLATTVREFSAEEGDILDLGAILQPAPGRTLAGYLRLVGQKLEIDADGDGIGFQDGSVVFEESNIPADLADLWDSGNLATGEIIPRTTLFLSSEGELAEENLSEVTLTFRRRGDANAPLTVPLSYAGTAEMGLDFATLPSAINFAPGEKIKTVTVRPFADDELETAETLQVTLASNSAWDIAAGSETVTLILPDLPSRVWLKIAERIGVRDADAPAQVLIHRSGPLSAPLTVQLSMAGTATSFIDYKRLPASVTFAAAQTVLALNVEPLATANLSNGAETVIVSISPDAGYLFGETREATLLLVTKPVSLAGWMAQKEVSQSREDFLSSDNDGDGLNGLAEFAFGGNPEQADSRVSQAEFVRTSDARFALKYRRHPFAPELSYVIKASTNLTVWNEVPGSEITEVSRILSDGMEEVTAVLPSNGETSCYFKVSFEIAP